MNKSPKTVKHPKVSVIVVNWNRRELLRGVASMANEAIRTADASEFWRIPMEGQRDPIVAARLAALMLQHGVEVRASRDNKEFVIPTAQPYSRFVDEMMGIQHYPEVRPAPNSGILEPYDVAAWSLPLMMGVRAEKAKLSSQEQQAATPIKSVTWPAGGLSGNASFYSVSDTQNNIFSLINAMQKAGGNAYVAKTPEQPPLVIFAAHPQLAVNAEKFHLRLGARQQLPQGATQLKSVRVGLYKPYAASIDEGWTRFVLEQFGFNLKNIENKEVKAGNLNASYDVIILPDSTREIILDGRLSREGYFEDFPPEYSGGIGREGLRAVRDFVDKGGTLITLNRSSEAIFGEEFNLPVRNAVAGAGAAP